MVVPRKPRKQQQIKSHENKIEEKIGNKAGETSGPKKSSKEDLSQRHGGSHFQVLEENSQLSPNSNDPPKDSAIKVAAISDKPKNVDPSSSKHR